MQTHPPEVAIGVAIRQLKVSLAFDQWLPRYCADGGTNLVVERYISVGAALGDKRCTGAIQSAELVRHDYFESVSQWLFRQQSAGNVALTISKPTLMKVSQRKGLTMAGSGITKPVYMTIIRIGTPTNAFVNASVLPTVAAILIAVFTTSDDKRTVKKNMLRAP